MDIARPQNKWKKRLVRGASVAVVLITLAAITLGISRLKPADPSVEKASVVIDTVQRGAMTREVRGYGTLVPEDIHWIPATTQGRVERILEHPGASVRPDSVLLELSNPELEREVIDANMSVKAAEADYTSLRVRLDKEVLDQKATLASIKASYGQATLQAELYEQLAADGLKSTLDMKLAQSQAEEMTTRYDIEKERLDIGSEAVDAQLAAQAARVDQSKAMAKLKQDQLASLRVQAGTKGVLALLPVEVGQQVTPGMNLARVANPERLKAEIKVPETQAKDIQVGQKATVDTHNGVISGHVVRIDPAVQGGSVSVDVAFDEALPKGARPDLSVDGTIELEHMDNVLYVGRPAFGQEKTLVGLFKLDDSGRAARAQVKLGRSSVNYVEVLEGLNAGDKIIISDMSAWDSFDHVRLN